MMIAKSLVRKPKLFAALHQQIMKAKTITLVNKFEHKSTESDYKTIEENLPPLKDGQFLAQAEYIAVDPYSLLSHEIGKTVIAEQVAKIIDSKNPKYPIGEYVLGEFGWKTHSIATETPGGFFKFPPRLLKDYGNLPRSLALGVLGMPGNTAYFGFLNVCKPKEGDTVVVSAAAGAVGLHVGQIAKIKGCHVVGVTGSNAKGERLIKEFNFDAFVNYKSDTFKNDLEAATPNRIDCYFDNVGGELSSIILNRMNKFGRVAICGSIATYGHDKQPVKASEVQTPVKIYHVRMEGFKVSRWNDEWDKGIEQNKQWLREGKIKYAESVVEGFDNLPRAFLGLFRGERFGKTILKV